MPISEKVGIKTGITARLQKKNKEGEVIKTTYFFPDFGVSVEAENAEEARQLAKAKASKQSGE